MFIARRSEHSAACSALQIGAFFSRPLSRSTAGKALLLGFPTTLASNDLGQTAFTWAADYGLVEVPLSSARAACFAPAIWKSEVLRLLLGPLCNAHSWAICQASRQGTSFSLP